MDRSTSTTPPAASRAPAEAKTPSVSHAARLSQAELARRWGISQASLERWRSTGQGPTYLKLQGQVRYRIEDVLAFEEQAARSSPSERA